MIVRADTGDADFDSLFEASLKSKRIGQTIEGTLLPVREQHRRAAPKVRTRYAPVAVTAPRDIARGELVRWTDDGQNLRLRGHRE